MFSVKSSFRSAAVLFAVVLMAAFAFHCGRNPQSTYETLREYVDTIKVVNTHEHQRWFSDFEGRLHNFYTILAHSYLQADLVSAGGPGLKPETINQGDLEALWKTYGPYLDFSRNTSYYSHFVSGFKLLYGFEDPFFTEENVKALSAKIAENYSHREDWYEKAFRQAGFETMFEDQYWDAFNTELDGRYFTLVFNINPLVSSVANREQLTAEDAPLQTNIYRLAKEEGKPIQTLDDYLAEADRLFQKFRGRHVACLKNSLAYSRSLEFAEVSYDDAKELFSRAPGGLSATEKKALADFMFHWIIGKSITLELPIQIHTGYLAGNGNVLENSRPTKLNNLFLKYPQAKFVLFHGGYPWMGEYAALGKMFPNVYLDLVWLPQISREAAVRGLDEMLDTVPNNKFFWGGDCHFIEESVGSLAFGKDIVAKVLAMRVERGVMTEALAKEVARQIFRDNAIRFFKLKIQS
jgi:hypothetical protein